MFSTFKQDRTYLTQKFRKDVCDPVTGLDLNTLKERLKEFTEPLVGESHTVIKAKAFEYVTKNVQIDVNPHDWFVSFGCWNRYDRPLNYLLKKWNSVVDQKHLSEIIPLINEFTKSGAVAMWKDFDHSVPDWDAVFRLGFPGLRKRARQYKDEREQSGMLTDEAKIYFDSIETVYSAILEMLERFHAYALANADGNERVLSVARCLKTLIHGAPTNTYEALQLIYTYFVFGEHIDHMQVRSLGNLDRILYSYYKKDLGDGLFTEENIREFFAYFLMQWGSINNYWGHPLYLGGTKENGETEINELSYLILDVFDTLSIPTPKIQLKINRNTPVPFVNKAMDMIRRGHSSLVFVCEPSVKRTMMAAGYSEAEARTFDITGCYEFGPRACHNSTAGAYLNLLKPLEWVLNNGSDPATGVAVGLETGGVEQYTTFDSFYSAYIRQLGHLIETSIQYVTEAEKYLHEINPAIVLSASIENSLKTAKDAFSNGTVYNNTSILCAGFGTLIDALMAVKEFVYEKNAVSLRELQNALKNNWIGYEKLRLKVLHSKNKFGNGIAAVDTYAVAVASFYAGKINLRPNARGGFYRASIHPARTFITLGEKTGATPDGRMSGDEMSKNASPTMGMDRNGVTALIKSVTSIDSAMFPGDFPLDVMMHPATVQGDDGLAAMRTLLNAYMEKHGIAIHFNIFDVKVLLDAQKYPEKYESLQVRVCGWNVRFNDIAKKEQDAYIRRAFNICE